MFNTEEAGTKPPAGSASSLAHLFSLCLFCPTETLRQQHTHLESESGHQAVCVYVHTCSPLSQNIISLSEPSGGNAGKWTDSLTPL